MQGRQAALGDGLPACSRMYSLMHPFDPVCYRCALPRRRGAWQLADAGRLLLLAATLLRGTTRESGCSLPAWSSCNGSMLSHWHRAMYSHASSGLLTCGDL